MSGDTSQATQSNPRRRPSGPVLLRYPASSTPVFTTVDLMMADHLPEGAFPYPPPGFEIILAGQGFGLGGAVVTTFREIGTPRSVGSYGWGGLAGTHQTLFWVDRKESLAGVVMLQARTDMRPPRRFESLVYQVLA